MTSTRLIVRPVEGDSIRSKKFKKLIDTNKHFALRRVHPLVVIADLRRGCLDSLNQYLRQEKGNLDRGVMVELRKLISGSRSRTDFRIMVVQHPDSPKDKGGRPGSHLRKPVKIEFDVAREFTELHQPGQVESAVNAIATKHKIKPSTVYKYAKLVAAYEAALVEAERERLDLERRWSDTMMRRSEALARIEREKAARGFMASTET